MTQARPEASVFIDDRERNLEPARLLGMRTIAFSDAGRLKEELAGLGVTEKGERGRGKGERNSAPA
jgi:FMN phosphatase YigB (HAD superfamily)